MTPAVLKRKQYEDIVENTQPFWYIRMITNHYCKLLCGLFFLYMIAAYACVELGLMTLDLMQNEDFFI